MQILERKVYFGFYCSINHFMKLDLVHDFDALSYSKL